MENNKVSFVLLGGVVFGILTLALSFLLSYLRVNQFLIYWGTLYAVEFGIYCLLLYFYKQWVNRVLWFSAGLTALIVITLVKSLLSTIVLFMLISFANRFAEPGISNFISILGIYARSFIFELALMGIAVKLFETDIFIEQRQKNEDVIDSL